MGLLTPQHKLCWQKGLSCFLLTWRAGCLPWAAQSTLLKKSCVMYLSESWILNKILLNCFKQKWANASLSTFPSITPLSHSKSSWVLLCVIVIKVTASEIHFKHDSSSCSELANNVFLYLMQQDLISSKNLQQSGIGSQVTDIQRYSCFACALVGSSQTVQIPGIPF